MKLSEEERARMKSDLNPSPWGNTWLLIGALWIFSALVICNDKLEALTLWVDAL